MNFRGQREMAMRQRQSDVLAARISCREVECREISGRPRQPETRHGRDVQTGLGRTRPTMIFGSRKLGRDDL